MGYFRTNTSVELRVGMPVQVYCPGEFHGAVAGVITHIHADRTVDVHPIGHHSRQMGTHPTFFEHIPVIARKSDLRDEQAWPDSAKYAHLVASYDLDREVPDGPALVRTGSDRVLLGAEPVDDRSAPAEEVSEPEAQSIEQEHDLLEGVESEELVWDESDNGEVFVAEFMDHEGSPCEATIEKMGAAWFLTSNAPDVPSGEAFDTVEDAKFRAGQYATKALYPNEEAAEA